MKLKQRSTNERTKTMKRSFWMLMMIFFVLAGDVFSKEWNGIVPCVSTRFDVDKILGKDGFRSPDTFGSYRYKNLRVYVDYERKAKSGPELDIVEKIDVSPDKSELLAKYIKKIPNFQRDFRKTELDDRITHVYGLAVYRNWAEGFEIWVQKNEEDLEVITRFGYFAPNLPSKSSSSWCG